MRIQVECEARRGGPVPRAFHLGQRRLRVVQVLSRDEEPAHRRFTVSVGNGRRFTLRQERSSGDWELVSVASERV